jgi:Ca2+ transporting ATPase
MEDAYVRSTQDVLKQFNVTQQSGLSDAAVQSLREKHGRNGK